jgi:iron complex outermembrane receptor protein
MRCRSTCAASSASSKAARTSTAWCSPAIRTTSSSRSFNIRPFAEGETDELTFKLDADLGFATLTGITGYSRITETNRADLDFRNPIASPGGFLGSDSRRARDRTSRRSCSARSAPDVGRRSARCAGSRACIYLNTDKSLRTRAFVDLNRQHQPDRQPGAGDHRSARVQRQQRLRRLRPGRLQLQRPVDRHGRCAFDRDEREQTDVGSGAKRNKSFDAWQPKLTLSYRPEADRTLLRNVSTGFRSVVSTRRACASRSSRTST